jgi:rubrerythrin
LKKIVTRTARAALETRRFYEQAACRIEDAHVRQLLDDLTQEERVHESRAQKVPGAPNAAHFNLMNRCKSFVLYRCQ